MQWSIMERGRASTEHQHLSFALDYFHHQFCLCAGLIGDSLTHLQAGASSMVAVFGAVLEGREGGGGEGMGRWTVSGRPEFRIDRHHFCSAESWGKRWARTLLLRTDRKDEARH